MTIRLSLPSHSRLKHLTIGFPSPLFPHRLPRHLPAPALHRRHLTLDYFSSNPSLLQSTLANHSTTDNGDLRELIQLLDEPKARRDHDLSRRVWRSYRRILETFHKPLHPEVHRKVLRCVVPSRSHLLRSNQSPYPNSRTQSYAKRIRICLAEMRNSVPDYSSQSTSSRLGLNLIGGLAPGDTRFAFATFAVLGSTSEAELLAGDIRRSGQHMDIKMIDSRLSALIRHMQHSSEKDLSRRSHSLLTTLQLVFADISVYKLKVRQLTSNLLVTATNRLAELAKGKYCDQLDGLLLELHQDVYGLDTKFMTLTRGFEAKASFTAVGLTSLAGLLSRQGDIWKMISAFEALGKMEALEARNIGEALVTSPGSAEVAVLALHSAELRPASEHVSQHSGLNHRCHERLEETEESRLTHSLNLELYREAASVMSETTSYLRTALHPTPRLDLSYDESRISTSAISILQRTARRVQDSRLTLHLLEASALWIWEIRVRWLDSLWYRHNLLAGDKRHSIWFDIPTPRAAFDTRWIADFHTSLSPHGPSVIVLQRSINLSRAILAFNTVEMRMLERIRSAFLDNQHREAQGMDKTIAALRASVVSLRKAILLYKQKLFTKNLSRRESSHEYWK